MTQLKTIHDIAKSIGVNYEEVYDTIKLIGEKPSGSELVLLYDNEKAEFIKKAVYQNQFITKASKLNEDWNPKKESLTQFNNRWRLDG